VASRAENSQGKPRATWSAVVGGKAGAEVDVDQTRLRRLTGYNVTRAHLRMVRAFVTDVGARVCLRPAEFSAMILIDANPGINQKQLSAALEISPPNLAVLIDQLCARGLLSRVRSEVDRRLQHPQLTRDGSKLLKRAESLADKMEADVLNLLSIAERAILIELLHKISI
jgi:DNA-binding MarR family transcriptional regulator